MIKIISKLGPGLLFAGAAIGVSHLVQSTRAGAEFGWGLIWALILVNIFKYPFFQYGPRYAIATGESLLDGYYKIGKVFLITYFILNLATMFTIQTAVDELLEIAERANIPSQIYHLKTSRKPNWHLLDSVIDKVESAREQGLKITADMYTYPASSTGLTGVIPTWVQEGGTQAWINRMKRPDIRERLFQDIRKELSEQPPEDILMVGFNKQSMSSKYRGMTIAEAAKIRGESPEEAIVNLIIEDGSRIQCIYFSMSEDNVRKKIMLPWVSFDSDAGSYSDISKDFITHPRAFGSFARVLGKYVREEKLITMEEAIRRLSGFPAENLGIKKRGYLKTGFFADVVVFDPKIIEDKATFEKPLQFAVGVEDVFVNGTQVLSKGEHTGNFSGRFVKGSGYRGLNNFED